MLAAAAALAASSAGCPRSPAVVPVTLNPEATCRFAVELAEDGRDTFPPISFSPDGTRLVAAADPGAHPDRAVVDGHVWIYDLERVRRTALPVHGAVKGGFYTARWSPDGRAIAVVADDRVEVLEPGGEVIARFNAPLGLALNRIGWSADARHLAVAGSDGVLYFVAVATGVRTDGDVYPARIEQIEALEDGFLVFHSEAGRLHRSYTRPGRRPDHRPDLVVRTRGTLSVVDAETAIVHDPQLGARLIVRSEEVLLVPGIRGGGGDLLVNAQEFRLSRDRLRLAFARVTCAAARCTSAARVMRCEGLAP